jgi:hypothetical protein
MAYSIRKVRILNQYGNADTRVNRLMTHQAVILDFINKRVSYVSLAKAASSVKPKAGMTFSAQSSSPPRPKSK